MEEISVFQSNISYSNLFFEKYFAVSENME